MERKHQVCRKFPKAIIFCVVGMSFIAAVYMVFKDPSVFLWNRYSLMALFLFCSSCCLLSVMYYEKNLIVIAIRLISGMGICFSAIQFLNVLRFGGFPSRRIDCNTIARKKKQRGGGTQNECKFDLLADFFSDTVQLFFCAATSTNQCGKA
ncbi:MAG: hypothetical protein IJK63_06655 [Oscillospiraceae bacterium]|nr:hypothetical protein [Oscillospiraceae bacterium]